MVLDRRNFGLGSKRPRCAGLSMRSSRLEAGCFSAPACIHLAISKPISRLFARDALTVIISFLPFDKCAPLCKGERAGDESNGTAAAAGSAEAEPVSGRGREGGQSTSPRRCHTLSIQDTLTFLDQGLLTRHAGPYETGWEKIEGVNPYCPPSTKKCNTVC